MECNPLTEGIVAAMVGALSAYLFNMLHWRHARKLEKKERYASALVRKIESYEALSVKYWTSSNEGVDDHYSMDLVTRKAVESEMRTAFLALNKHTKSYLSDYFSADDKYDMEEEFNAELRKLFDLSTGGDFENTERIRQPRNASRISSICTDLTIRFFRSVAK